VILLNEKTQKKKLSKKSIILVSIILLSTISVVALFIIYTPSLSSQTFENTIKNDQFYTATVNQSIIPITSVSQNSIDTICNEGFDEDIDIFESDISYKMNGIGSGKINVNNTNIIGNISVNTRIEYKSITSGNDCNLKFYMDIDYVNAINYLYLKINLKDSTKLYSLYVDIIGNIGQNRADIDCMPQLSLISPLENTWNAISIQSLLSKIESTHIDLLHDIDLENIEIYISTNDNVNFWFEDFKITTIPINNISSAWFNEDNTIINGYQIITEFFVQLNSQNFAIDDNFDGILDVPIYLSIEDYVTVISNPESVYTKNNEKIYDLYLNLQESNITIYSINDTEMLLYGQILSPIIMFPESPQIGIELEYKFGYEFSILLQLRNEYGLNWLNSQTDGTYLLNDSFIIKSKSVLMNPSSAFTLIALIGSVALMATIYTKKKYNKKNCKNKNFEFKNGKCFPKLS